MRSSSMMMMMQGRRQIFNVMPLLLLVCLFFAVTSVATSLEENEANNTDMNDERAVETEAARLLETAQDTTHNEHEQQHINRNLQDLVYSNMATIVPDPEHLAIDEATHDALDAQWESWHFWDGTEDERPTGDYCGEFDPLYRDIGADDFPDESWQVDAVFVNHLLNDGEKLVARAMEAIFTEYGHGKPLPPEGLGERLKMFHWEKIDMTSTLKVPRGFERRGGKRRSGGWTTKRSHEGLVRRLLHAMMTNDEFVVVLGGHSAAAGHGNHFRQSYMHQFHRIVSPILARLGVKLITRNMSQGGLGTLQASMGLQDIYGNGIDLLLWDSGMTEPGAAHKDFFVRQALLGSAGKTKIPVVWGGAGAEFDVLKYLHEEADIDVGQFGTGMEGVIPVTSAEQAKTEVPYASRYMECAPDVKHLCDAAPRFCATCWIDRDDIADAKTLFPNMKNRPGSQVKWHPGWRAHQLQGRVLAFAVLDALQVALQIWSDGTMGGPPLDDEDWHVTDYYANMRTKLQALAQREESGSGNRGKCWEMEQQGMPGRICTTALHGATQHTPRANPDETSVTKLIRPAANGYKPENLVKQQYEGPDVHNPCFDPEEGAVDVVAIVSGRRRGRRRLSSYREEEEEEEEQYMPRLFRQLHEARQARVAAEKEQERRALDAASTAQQSSSSSSSSNLRDPRELLELDDQKIEPGIGWQVEGELPGVCDGSYYAICGRQESNGCPLLGHHDGRGQVVGNEYSGWLVMDVPDVKKGLIILKLFSWNAQAANQVTDGWTSVNNQGGSQGRQRERHLSRNNETATTIMAASLPFLGEEDMSYIEYTEEQQDDNHHHYIQDQRSLGGPQPAASTLPEDTFRFDFAIDGKITTWNKQEFLENQHNVQRVVELFTLLDDPNYVPDGQSKNVEVAIRMRGCGRLCTFGVTHIYWA